MVFVELTCPCEENMVLWHDTKLMKYEALKSSIVLSDWQVDIFAVEVGARGYCSKSMLTCLRTLDL